MVRNLARSERLPRKTNSPDGNPLYCFERVLLVLGKIGRCRREADKPGRELAVKSAALDDERTAVNFAVLHNAVPAS
jgi:hypothetical protein